jgi:hypothetical protein
MALASFTPLGRSAPWDSSGSLCWTTEASMVPRLAVARVETLVRRWRSLDVERTEAANASLAQLAGPLAL